MAIGGMGTIFDKLAESAGGFRGSALMANITQATIGTQAAGTNQLVSQGLEKEIQRLQGFKTNLGAPQLKRLAEVKAEIQNIESKFNSLSMPDYIKAKHTRLNEEAYKILGKTYVDVEADPKLDAVKSKIDALLEPQLRGAKKTRLDNLRKYEKNLQGQFFQSPNNTTLLRQISNVGKQIANLVPPRLISELTPAERRTYDGLVKELNTKAGTEVYQNSTTQLKIENIQKTIGRFGG